MFLGSEPFESLVAEGRHSSRGQCRRREVNVPKMGYRGDHSDPFSHVRSVRVPTHVTHVDRQTDYRRPSEARGGEVYHVGRPGAEGE